MAKALFINIKAYIRFLYGKRYADDPIMFNGVLKDNIKHYGTHSDPEKKKIMIKSRINYSRRLTHYYRIRKDKSNTIIATTYPPPYKIFPRETKQTLKSQPKGLPAKKITVDFDFPLRGDVYVTKVTKGFLVFTVSTNGAITGSTFIYDPQHKSFDI